MSKPNKSFYTVNINGMEYVFTNISRSGDEYIGNAVGSDGKPAQYMSRLSKAEIDNARVTDLYPKERKLNGFMFTALVVNKKAYEHGGNDKCMAQLHFPTDKETVSKTLREIGLPPNASPDSYFLNDFRYDNGRAQTAFPTQGDISEFNYLSEMMYRMTENERRVFDTAVDMGLHTDDIADLINLSLNTDCFEVIEEVNYWEEVGAYAAEKNGADISTIGNLADFIDYEAYGKSYAEKTGGKLGNNMYFDAEADDYEVIYDKNINNIPKAYRVTDSLYSVDKQNPFSEHSGKIEDNGADNQSEHSIPSESDIKPQQTAQQNRPERKDCVLKAMINNNSNHSSAERKAAWLYFPTDRETVKRTLDEINVNGSGSPDSYFFNDFVFTSNNRQMGFPMHCSIDELNYLAHAVQGLNDTEFEVFCNAVDADRHAESVKDLINLAYNTESYEFIPQASDYTELAEYRLSADMSIDKDTIDRISEYIDYHTMGRDILREENGFFINDAYMCPDAADFKEIYEGDFLDFPEEYAVTDYGREMKNIYTMEKAIDIAFDIDSYFRRNDEEYRNTFTDIEEQSDYMYDCVINGRTADIKNNLHKQHTEEAENLINAVNDFEAENLKNMFFIYQVKDGPDFHYHRFEPLDRLHEQGLHVERGSYDLVYSSVLDANDNPEKIFARFNLDLAKDYKGRSMSVSDVLVMRRNGKDTAYYCDRVGFKEVPEFLNEKLRETVKENTKPIQQTAKTRTDQEKSGQPKQTEQKQLTDKKPSVRMQLKIMAKINENKDGGQKQRKPPEIGG